MFLLAVVCGYGFNLQVWLGMVLDNLWFWTIYGSGQAMVLDKLWFCTILVYYSFS